MHLLALEIFWSNENLRKIEKKNDRISEYFTLK